MESGAIDERCGETNLCLRHVPGPKRGFPLAVDWLLFMDRRNGAHNAHLGFTFLLRVSFVWKERKGHRSVRGAHVQGNSA